MEESNSIEDVTSSFLLMWGNYPSPVMLLKKNHTIIEVNEAGKTLGIQKDTKCYSLRGQNTICDGCKASSALKKGEGLRHVAYSKDFQIILDSYWIPLKESSEYYVHFGNDITGYCKDEVFETAD